MIHFSHKFISVILLACLALYGMGVKANTNPTAAQQTSTDDKKNTTTTQKAADVAIVTSDIISKNALIKIEEALNGTVAGLYSIRKSNAAYGMSQLNFFVRGKATLADNSPLIFVDGVLSNIDFIHPNEIEEIVVIKDPVELAIYGQRGANGIIHLKTKRGVKTRSFMQVELNAGMQMPEYIAPKTNAYQYSLLHNEANTNDGTTTAFDAQKFNGEYDPYLYPRTDFMNDFLAKTGEVKQFNFTAGGGNDVARYFTLLAYTRQDGIFTLPFDKDKLKPTYNERYNFRTNLDVNLGAGFKLSSNVSAVFDDRRSPWVAANQSVNNSNNYIFNLLYSTPANAFPLQNPNGSLGGTSVYRENPIAMLSAGQRSENTRLLLANVMLSKDMSNIVKGLSADIHYTFENYNAYYKANYSVFAVSQYNEDGTYTEYGVNDTKVNTTGGQLNDYYSDVNSSLALNYTTKMGVANIHFSTSINDYRSYVAGDVPPYRWLSNINRFDINFANKYIANFAASYQGSNSYASGKRIGFFPAASFKWVLSNEHFLQSNDKINHLSAKLSAALLGNDRTGGERFMYRQAFFNANGYGFGIPNGNAQGSYEGTLSNPDATWEKAYHYGLNIDAALFDNKLQLNAALFHENRTDILVQQSNLTSAVVGVKLPMLNAGIINNSGIETSLRYNYNSGHFSAFAIGNIAYIKNKIIDIKELEYPDNEQYRYRRNQPIDALFGFVSEGIFQSEQEIADYNVLSSFGDLKPGDIRYKDLNNDGIINNADRAPIANLFPNIVYGIGTGMQYKAFDFYMHIEGAADYQKHLIPNMFSTYAFDNRYYGNNTQGTYPRLSFASEHNMQTSDYWVENAHLIRLSNIELGYSLPKSTLDYLRIDGLRVYVRGNELLSTKTSREKRDFESHNAGMFNYPFYKTVMAGLKLTL